MPWKDSAFSLAARLLGRVSATLVFNGSASSPTLAAAQLPRDLASNRKETRLVILTAA